jgi:MATE family multidrug resistance protein
MLAMAILFITASEPLMSIFAGDGPESARIVEAGSLLMKFVAFYCMFDAANIMIGCALASAGDTNWIASTFFICTSVFLILLWLVDRVVPGLFLEWSLATLFVFVTAVVWSIRFRVGAWRKIKVLRG